MSELTAAYIRVSTDEQRLHGISLDAQRDKLKEYATTHNLNIVAWYEDEGVSGRKLIKNRPALQRMLNDAHAKKFQRIIFIKLDRFFRSVAEYHECMKYIEPVIWTATEEKYDLSSANGRAFVNMKLTIAELEADQTGERIKIVNDYKVKAAQATTGAQSQGYAYTVKKIDGVKRVVKDPETEPVVNDYINYFLIHHNKSQAYTYVKDKYNLSIGYNSLSKILTDTKIYGSYKGNPNYCEPYIDKETFDKIQLLLSKNIKRTAANRIYIFSGLIKCPECGKVLVGRFTGLVNMRKKSGKTYTYYKNYYSYRCNNSTTNKNCSYRKNINEDKIEAQLLDNLNQYITDYITSVKITDASVDKDTETINNRIKEIKQEMSNSVKSFNKGRMSEEDHDKEYTALEAELTTLQALLSPHKERDLTIYEDLLKSGWKELYKALNKENKRAFWHKYIKEIRINEVGVVSPIFF